MTGKDLRERAVKGVVWSAIEGWGGHLLNAAVILVLARLLQPSDFGLLALATAMVALAELVVVQGISGALIQRPDLEAGHVRAGYVLTVSAASCLVALLIAFAPALEGILGTEGLATVLRVLSLGLLVSAVSGIPMALLRRNLEFRSLTTASLVGNSVGGLVGVLLAVMGAGVMALVVQILVGQTATGALLFRFAQRPGRCPAERRHYRDILTFGLPMLSANFMGFATARVPDLIIGAIGGPTALGYYSMATRGLDTLYRAMVQPVAATALPAFSSLRSAEGSISAPYLTATRLLSTASAPVFAVAALLAPWGIPLVAGAQWAPSVPIFQALMVMGYVQAVFSVNGSALAAVGRPSVYAAVMALSLVLDVAIFIHLTPISVPLAVWAKAARTYLTAPVAVLAVAYFADVPVNQFLFALLPSVSASGSAALVLLLGQALAVPIILACVVAVLTYLVVLHTLDPTLVSTLRILLQSVWPRILCRSGSATG